MPRIQTIFDAVAFVLREFGPQDADSLASMMLDMRLWHVKGRNPAAALHRLLLQHSADHGPTARFRLLDTGQFDLNSARSTNAEGCPLPHHHEEACPRMDTNGHE